MRRREQPRPDRTEAPPWICYTYRGLRHFGGVRPDGALVLGGDAYARLTEAQDAWCRENGCWRPGSKTCDEVGPRPCPARREVDG
jgi:hypothetical protein